ncbi:MAG: putative metal-binding motif-containing protein [Patescibacteria group bacterium]|nr:putative metal-binding motif-containing protein [Patescibacteria group bacterium]
MKKLVWLVSILAAVVGGCSMDTARWNPEGTGGTAGEGGSGGTGGTACEPHAVHDCACPGGLTGSQWCYEDGSGYGTCQCPLPTGTFCRDADADGYGNAADCLYNQTTQPSGFVGNGNDCDDNRHDVNPGMTEICSNGLDDNCNGQIDEGCGTGGTGGSGQVCTPLQSYSCNEECPSHDGTKWCWDTGAGFGECQCKTVSGTYCRDADGDTYGDPAQCAQYPSPPAGYVNNSGDCNDSNPNINPGKSETCGNGIDDDCDGQIDQGCGTVTYTYYRDADGDGHGNASQPLQSTSTTPPAGYVASNDDCDDNNGAVWNTCGAGGSGGTGGSGGSECNGPTEYDTIVAVIVNSPATGNHRLDGWWQPPCEPPRSWAKICDMTQVASGKYSCTFQVRHGSTLFEFQNALPNGKYWGDTSCATGSGCGHTLGTMYIYEGSENASNEQQYVLISNGAPDLNCSGCNPDPNCVGQCLYPYKNGQVVGSL